MCFFEDIRIYSKHANHWFSLLSVCVHQTSCRADRWQVDRHRTGRVKKNHNILRKNTIFTEHPVAWGFNYPLLFFVLHVIILWNLGFLKLSKIVPTFFLIKFYFNEWILDWRDEVRVMIRAVLKLQHGAKQKVQFKLRCFNGNCA